jgi:hypothetical protein
MIAQLHQPLLQVIPGGGRRRSRSAAQAKTLLAGVRPGDAVGKARCRVPAEPIANLGRINQRKKAADQELTASVRTTRSKAASETSRCADPRRRRSGWWCTGPRG